MYDGVVLLILMCNRLLMVDRANLFLTGVCTAFMTLKHLSVLALLLGNAKMNGSTLPILTYFSHTADHHSRHDLVSEGSVNIGSHGSM